MNEEQFINLTAKDYISNKKYNNVMKAAKKLLQTEDVKNKLKEIEITKKFLGLGSFFPTPKKYAKRFVEIANVNTIFGDILEPSAGTGNIAEEIRENFPDKNLDCIEISQEMSEYLKEKGFNTFNMDFLNFTTDKKYGLVIMNPPFEDIVKHFIKASSLIHNDGYVLSIVPCTFKQTNSYKKIINELGIIVYDEEISFKEVGINMVCNIAEIDAKKIRELKQILYDFFCNDKEPYFIRLFSCYLDGSYGNVKFYENVVLKTQHPTNEQLLQWFTDFLHKNELFSYGFCEKQVAPYKMFVDKLRNFYSRVTEEYFKDENAALFWRIKL